MTQDGQISEDVYALEQVQQYVGDLYKRRLAEKGGSHNDDTYAENLRGVMRHAKEAAKVREAEGAPIIVSNGYTSPPVGYDIDDYWSVYGGAI